MGDRFVNRAMKALLALAVVTVLGGCSSELLNSVKEHVARENAVPDTDAPTGSLSINAGDVYSTSTSVTLTIAATDTGGGVVQDMEVRNDTAFTGNWQSYQASLPWTLDGPDGTDTVYIRFRDNSGNISGAYSDTIILDRVSPTITSRTPSSGASNISRTTNITVNFSESINQATLTSSSVYLRIKGGATVSSAMTKAATSVTLNPTANLLYGYDYTIVVTSAVTDLSGRAITNPGSTDFTVERDYWEGPNGNNSPTYAWDLTDLIPRDPYDTDNWFDLVPDQQYEEWSFPTGVHSNLALLEGVDYYVVDIPSGMGYMDVRVLFTADEDHGEIVDTSGSDSLSALRHQRWTGLRRFPAGHPFRPALRPVVRAGSSAAASGEFTILIYETSQQLRQPPQLQLADSLRHRHVGMRGSAMKKLLAFTPLLLLTASLAVGQSLTVSVLPTLEIPLAASADLYTAGGGVDVAGVYALQEASGLRFSGAAGYRLLPSLGTTNLSLVSLTGGIGYQYELLPRLLAYADARAGGYYGLFGDAGALDFLANAEVGLVFAMSSGFRLGAAASIVGYLADPEPLFTGLGIRLVGSFAPGRGGPGKPRLQIIDPHFEPLFPVFYKWYDSNPAGSIVIVNKENRPIRNVKASILVREFMDAPKVFAEIAALGKGESLEVPVLALFNDGILTVTESTKVAAEITVSYDLADGSLQVMHAETLRVLDRNAMTWADDRRAASFVTPRDPALLSLAKAVAASVRDDGGAGGDLNFRVAMAMFEALGLFGVSYVVDPKSSYADLSNQSSAIDYLQFPRQTLKYRSGDCDDLTILYASLLESVGIETAFITVPGHILPAVALSLSPEEAQSWFYRSDRLIVDGGVVYVPVEATMFSKGFNAAWTEGARQWRDAGSAARIIPVREAWKVYEAVGLREADPELLYPSSGAILVAFRTQLDRFVSDELAPQVAALESAMRTRGGTARDLNRLGILYARYGRYADAEAEFRKLLQQDGNRYVPALVNLANVFYLRGDAATAAAWFDRALLQDPRNRHALAGSVKARAEMGDAVAAAGMLDRLRQIDAAAAEAIAHLTSADSGTGRASSAQTERRVIWSD